MAGMFALLDRLDATELKPIVITCLEQSQYEWLALNRGQLHDGQDNTGALQSPLYKLEGYAEYKNQLNPVPGLGVPDFFVSGGYYNSIRVKVTPSGIETYSDSELAPKLESRWTRNYGLDPENLGYYNNEIIRPKLILCVKDKLGL